MKDLIILSKSQLSEPLFLNGCTVVQLEKSPIANRCEFMGPHKPFNFFN